MPDTTVRIPDWANPQNASVLDNWFTRALRAAGGVIGAADPTAQAMALGTPLEVPGGESGLQRVMKALKIGPSVEVPEDAGFAYHATNVERLHDIAESGKLKVHKPYEFTDQDVWPDGSTQKRAYFGSSPKSLWQFAPEHGDPVILRTPRSSLIERESGTGDLFTQRPVKSDQIQYLGTDGAWHPVNGLKGQ